jgi:DNA repair exonuclease SbcCD ATPase subunit
MSEYLDAVREQLDEGTVSPQALVLLFRAAEEAEERRDVQELEQTLELARRIADEAGEGLEAEAKRLIALCEERLERARAPIGSAEASTGDAPCPGCGRPVPASAVRCRACGTLLV